MVCGAASKASKGTLSLAVTMRDTVALLFWLEFCAPQRKLGMFGVATPDMPFLGVSSL
jgi:hypothetical protein